jgi:hypothetical protein
MGNSDVQKYDINDIISADVQLKKTSEKLQYEYRELSLNFSKAVPAFESLEALFDFSRMRIVSALAVPKWYWEDHPAWHQTPTETFREWGERISREGYLDNPKIRWQYQKQVFKTLFRWLHLRD